MNEQELGIAVVIVSLVFRLGWSYSQQKQANNQFFQTLSERWFGHLAQSFYFIGIPYFAIIFGILPPKLLGLKGVTYFDLIILNSDLIPQVQQAVTLMLLEWLLDSSLMVLAGLVALLLFGGICLGLKQHRVTMGLARTSTLHTVYYSLHWAFYRAVFWSITGDLYLGVVFGSSFVVLEWVLVDALQKQWSTRQPQFLTNIIILVLTATIFFYSPNLWLLFPLHLGLVAIIHKGQGATGIEISPASSR
jgi:hypothetical protein